MKLLSYMIVDEQEDDTPRSLIWFQEQFKKVYEREHQRLATLYADALKRQDVTALKEAYSDISSLASYYNKNTQNWSCYWEYLYSMTDKRAK